METTLDSPRTYDLGAYRVSAPEQLRVASLLSMVPPGTRTVLDVGTRDGHFAILLAEQGLKVTALDLQLPRVKHPNVTCVQGNAAALDFADQQFDLVLCAEVLEHIPSPALERACQELVRVSRRHVLIGVPFDQDIRVGRTTCGSCGRVSPPWGHVNSLDDKRLLQLFAPLLPFRTERVGQAGPRTNALACWLMDLAGNPFGTYGQEEACTHCGKPLLQPGPRRLEQKLLTRLSVWAQALGTRQVPKANWIHMLFQK